MHTAPTLVRLRRGALTRSVVEGVLYSGMVGLGEFWLAADAVRQQAGPLAMAAIVTLPQLVGALGAVGMLRLLRRARGRRGFATAAVVGQGLGYLTLAALTAAGATTPLLLVILACALQACAQAAGTAWSSWYGDVLPARLRGRWFGRRNQWCSATTFSGIVVGGLLLHVLEPPAAEAAGSGGTGYALLYALAGLLRLSCAPLLLASWEPTFIPPDARDDLKGELFGPSAAAGRGVIALGAGMLFSVCVAAPFFVPHMLEDLRFSYPVFLTAQGLQVATKVLALRGWGRLVDRKGPVAVYRLTAVLVALVPLPWVFATRPEHAWLVLLAQAFSGIAWAGNEVAMLSLTLAARGDRRRAVLLAAQSVSNGSAQILGGITGSGLSELSGHAHGPMFAASAAARLLVAIVTPTLLRPLVAVRVRTADVAAQVSGWRPGGGVVRKLLQDDRTDPHGVPRAR